MAPQVGDMFFFHFLRLQVRFINLFTISLKILQQLTLRDSRVKLINRGDVLFSRPPQSDIRAEVILITFQINEIIERRLRGALSGNSMIG